MLSILFLLVLVIGIILLGANGANSDMGLLRDWDEKYGDRMQKIVFIGQHMDKEQIIRDLDECLEE